jgi:hypothetical protein
VLLDTCAEAEMRSLRVDYDRHQSFILSVSRQRRRDCTNHLGINDVCFWSGELQAEYLLVALEPGL